MTHRTYDDWKTTDPSWAQDDAGIGDWTECWSCGGDGLKFDCIDGCCMDADIGCDLCTKHCDICKGDGGWPTHPAAETTEPRP